MIESIEAKRFICDGCGKTIVVAGDEDPLGFHGGQVFEHHKLGGQGCNDWFACSERCIRKAVINAIYREQS